MTTMNHNNNNKKLFKRNQFNKLNQNHKSKDQRLLLKSQELKILEISMALLDKNQPEEVAEEKAEVAVEATEVDTVETEAVIEVDIAVAEAAVVRDQKVLKVKRDPEEVAEVKEEKVKKDKRVNIDQEAEAEEVAAEREEKVKKVKLEISKRVIDQEEEAEVEVEADLKEKEKVLKVMKVFSTLKEKRELITLERKSTSKVKPENNGTHWTENPELEEVEVQPKVEPEEVTGVDQKMKLNKQSLRVKRPPPPMLKVRRPRVNKPKRPRPRNKPKLKKKPNKRKKLRKRRRKASLLRNSEPKERLLALRKKPERLKKSLKPTLKKLIELITESTKSQVHSETKNFTALPRDKMLNSLDSKVEKTISTLLKREEVAEAAEEAVEAEVAVVAEVQLKLKEVLDHQEETNN